jgi:hypothetical protein
MNQGRDETRRNRNIGTSKQWRGQNNRLIIPWCGLKLYYENLTEYKVAERTVHSRSLPLYREEIEEEIRLNEED